MSNLPKFIQPGQFFSLFFTVSQPDAQSLNPKITQSQNHSITQSPNHSITRLILPTDWKILTEKKLQPYKDSFLTKYIYTISTPSQALAGTYLIDFQILKGDTILANRKTSVNLQAVRHIEIVPLNQPEFVKEGDVLKIEYLIQNFGNKTERLKLETSRGHIESVKDSVDINPNSYMKVFVTQDIPQTDSYNSWQTSSDLKVNFANQDMPVFQLLSIPVYSTKAKKNDPFLRFPIEIGGGFMQYAIGKQTRRAYQYNAEGRGFLDFSKKHYLDFTVRGPNQAAFPSVNNYDQYSFSYTHLTKTNVVLGDYVLRFNNLMEFGRFGRGVKIEQTVGQGQITAFYQQARFFPNQKDAFGGSYKRFLEGKSWVSFDVISKNLVENNAHFRSNMLGVSSFVKKEKYTNETELSLGYAQNKLDFGLFNKFNFVYKRLNFNSEVIHAGKNFYGFYTNSLLFVNGLTYYLTPKINMGANTNITRINPSHDILKYSTSPYSTLASLFVSYQPNPKNMFFLNITTQEREDRQRPSTFHYQEDFANVSYNFNARKLVLSSQARYGFAQNLMTTDSLGKKQATAYFVQPSVALRPWLWVGGYFEHQHTTKFSLNDSYQNLYYYGGNVRLNYKKNISLNFMYRNNYAPDEFFEKRSFMDGSFVLDYQKHQLSVNSGRAFLPNLPNNEQNSFFFNIKYLVKLNVPIKKDKKVGYLKGQITTLSEGIKRRGILMQVGQYKVLTDSAGQFTLPNLMPNTYYLTMPNNSDLVGVVSTLKMPIVVHIKADSTAFLTIPLVKTGGIVGNVVFEKAETPPSRDNRDVPSVKPTIYIKLSNERESFVTEINAQGAFSFKEMKPGLWKLKAIIPNNNEQFEILNPAQDIEVESDKIKTHRFSVKIIQRTIQFSGKSFHVKSQ